MDRHHRHPGRGESFRLWQPDLAGGYRNGTCTGRGETGCQPDHGSPGFPYSATHFYSHPWCNAAPPDRDTCPTVYPCACRHCYGNGYPYLHSASNRYADAHGYDCSDGHFDTHPHRHPYVDQYPHSRSHTYPYGHFNARAYGHPYTDPHTDSRSHPYAHCQPDRYVYSNVDTHACPAQSRGACSYGHGQPNPQTHRSPGD
jgi:hypothetical protein